MAASGICNLISPHMYHTIDAKHMIWGLYKGVSYIGMEIGTVSRMESLHRFKTLKVTSFKADYCKRALEKFNLIYTLHF